MPFIKDDVCNFIFNPYGYIIEETMMCAGLSSLDQSGGRDFCDGDLGGPLVDSETGVCSY